jgi:TonB family protein
MRHLARVDGAQIAGPQKAGEAESDGYDEASRLRRKVEPAYSEEARKAKFQGHVVLGMDVNASGEVTNPRVLRSLGLGLDEKALEAVRQWQFDPAIKDSRAVSAYVQVEMNFRLL